MNVEYLKYFLLYFLIINIVGFLSMGIDKYKSKHNMWRIPESTLLFIALLLGSIGSYIGMYTFRHKTLHAKFKYGIPIIFIINIICIYYIFQYFIILK